MESFRLRSPGDALTFNTFFLLVALKITKFFTLYVLLVWQTIPYLSIQQYLQMKNRQQMNLQVCSDLGAPFRALLESLVRNVRPAKLRDCTATGTGQATRLFSNRNKSLNCTVKYYQFKNVFPQILKPIKYMCPVLLEHKLLFSLFEK